MGISRDLFCLAGVDPFRPGRPMILRHRWSVHQRVAIVPGHPVRGLEGKFLCMSEQFREIADGIGAIQLAGVDQAHIQVADLSTLQGLIEETVFPVQNRFFQTRLVMLIPPMETVRFFQMQTVLEIQHSVFLHSVPIVRATAMWQSDNWHLSSTRLEISIRR